MSVGGWGATQKRRGGAPSSTLILVLKERESVMLILCRGRGNEIRNPRWKREKKKWLDRLIREEYGRYVYSFPHGKKKKNVALLPLFFYYSPGCPSETAASSPFFIPRISNGRGKKKRDRCSSWPSEDPIQKKKPSQKGRKKGGQLFVQKATPDPLRPV